ncbi:hypothetical protein Rsub_02184 [Raphidocelis subcapitata]|uniref:Protein kinase domain-containing protein n=1 Tax=Raphidocelis subcapitata TaxID=307507 RepID=A0A2V0NWJ1_9CHLO|nr:hypothetical protein Rsub_02184 [Raphidocelis subcapitata]|eukprot:GBF89307.1 hypothetical protein Rsub_02184 [Raphidocelis subcapitata]
MASSWVTLPFVHNGAAEAEDEESPQSAGPLPGAEQRVAAERPGPGNEQWLVSVLQPGFSEQGSQRLWRPRLRGWWRTAKGVVPVLRARPSIILICLLATAALAAVSGLGVVLAADAEAQSRRLAAQGFVQETAAGFETTMLNYMAPLLALSVFVRDSPSVPHMAQSFDRVANELLAIARGNASHGGVRLRLAPGGVVRLAAPANESRGVLGLDLLKDPLRRAAALEGIRRRQMTVQGPIPMKEEGFVGLVMRLPIFIENVTNPEETFGASDRFHNCSVCYDPATKSRLWGFAGSVVNFEQIAGGSGIANAIGGWPGGGEDGAAGPGLLGRLERQGYNYVLSAPQPGGSPVVIAQTRDALRSPAAATIRTPTNEGWQLHIAPRGGWVPPWRDALLAMVLLISTAAGLLLLAVLVNRHQQAWLLAELRTRNDELTTEKLRANALLARQYNLIGCLMEQQGAGGTGGGAGGGGGKRVPWGPLDTPGTALERIEDVRRAIGAGAAAHSSEELQLTDMLGEGGFGKVYKGLWHGIVVAIKTMLLPASLSGAQKRERMAIMEAAISSAIQHPNIIQTYTYVIRPMASTHAPAEREGPAPKDAVLSDSPAAANSQRVLNYEVSLVLEYCELGSLRDALDGGAYRLANGTLNYAAILDTAADVARAMLHLHRQQIIHSDLKARNVLLKASKSGRGAVAKVADFGLALQIESHDTHVSAFQGTPSHMAPEAQMYGRMSKAADVYSYAILLWEVYTGGHAFSGTPTALLGYQVSVDNARPRFPPGTPPDFKRLVKACWAPNPADRPPFDQVLEAVVAMRQRVAGPTPRLSTYTLRYGPVPSPPGAPPAAVAAAAAGAGAVAIVTAAAPGAGASCGAEAGAEAAAAAPEAAAAGAAVTLSLGPAARPPDPAVTAPPVGLEVKGRWHVLGTPAEFSVAQEAPWRSICAAPADEEARRRQQQQQQQQTAGQQHAAPGRQWHQLPDQQRDQIAAAPDQQPDQRGQQHSALVAAPAAGDQLWPSQQQGSSSLWGAQGWTADGGGGGGVVGGGAFEGSLSLSIRPAAAAPWLPQPMPPPQTQQPQAQQPGGGSPRGPA